MKWEEKLWSMVDRSAGPNGCWPWTGAKSKGYGTMRMPGNAGMRYAHRMAWISARGRIRSDGSYHGTCVLHRCDNPACCNPAHLFLGSTGDNTRDAMRKGRLAPRSGELNGQAKLTWTKVNEIRRKWETGVVLQKDLAEEYVMSKMAISLIVRNKNWVYRNTGGKPPAESVG